MNLFEKLLGQNPQTTEQPIIMPPLQANPNLGTNGLPIKQQNQPMLKNLMLGNNGQMLPQEQTNKFYANENNVDTPVIEMGLNRTPEKIGMLQDIANGAKDNFNNPISAANFRPDENKTIANKFGEVIGTIGRGLNSSGGRGLMTGVGVLATGGNPTQAMTYGLQAGLGNYNNVQQDRMNRQLLQANGVNTEGIRGYLNNDMAKSYTDNYYKLNNAQYRNKKLSQDSYLKFKKQFEDMHRNNQIDSATLEANIKALNERYMDDNIETVETGNVQSSNQTNKTNSSIKVDTARIQQMKTTAAQNDQKIKLMEKRISMYGGTLAQKQQLDALKIQQYSLINNLLKNPGKGGTPNINVGGGGDPLGLFEE